MGKDNIELNRLHIPGLQNYYKLEAGILPSEMDRQETIEKITKNTKGKEQRE